MSYKCDKCGKEVEYIKWITNEYDMDFPCHYSFTIDLAGWKGYHNYELCEECYNKIKEILDNADKGLNSSREEK